MKFHCLMALLLCLAVAAPAQNAAEMRVFKRAIGLLNQEKYKEAIPLWEKLVAKGPQKALYWYNLGSAYFGADSYEKAYSAFGRVLLLPTEIAPLAKLYQAKTQKNLNRPLVARKMYETVLAENPPPNLKKMATDDLNVLVFELGRNSYKAGHFENALMFFQQSMDLQPTPEAAIMIAFSYLRNGEPEKAREGLNRALDFAPNAKSREEALFFLRQIKENIYKKRKPYWMWTDIAAGHNSNFYENGNSEENSHAAFGQLTAGIGYHFFDESKFSLEPSYLFSWQEIAQIPNARVQTHTLQSPIYFNEGVWFVEFSPYVQDQHLSFYPFINKYGASLKVQRSFDSHDLGVIYDQSQSFAQDSYYDYLNGSSQVEKIYWSYNAKMFATNLYLAHANEFIGDLPYSNGTVPLSDQIFGIGGGLDYFLSSLWTVYGSLSYYQKDYLNNSQPDGKKRVDNQAVLYGKVSYIFSKNLRAYLSHEATINKSTLSEGDIADKNFNKFVTFLGLTWTVL